MPRLFLFAIGGTGSRVLKSLTMLLASGIKPENRDEFEIVPIIIDPHVSNKDLQRTSRLLDNYQAIVKAVGKDNGFFATKISTVDKLLSGSSGLSGAFTYNLQEVNNTKFRDYIEYDFLNPASKALTELLFSGRTIGKHGEPVDLLDLEMDIGFVGNPNIGSVVLNQFRDSAEFAEFASNFNEKDRIFIISSIFGGTGAAGFPAILKNIRNATKNDNIDSKGFLQNARIGALTVLPYFNIAKDQDSPIQKSDFIAKSKSALSYYIKNVNPLVNALYYVADDYIGKAYDNDAGNKGQQNQAHIIEMIGALAVIDFLGISDNNLVTGNGRAEGRTTKEFEVLNGAVNMKFADFEDKIRKELTMNLSQFQLFVRYLEEHLEKVIGKQPWTEDEPKIDRSFLDDSFYHTHLSEFLNSWKEWIKEMSANERGFSPFHLNLDTTISAFIQDKAGKAGLLKRAFAYHHYDDRLNEISRTRKDYASTARKLISLFFEATGRILEKNYELNH